MPDTPENSPMAMRLMEQMLNEIREIRTHSQQTQVDIAEIKANQKGDSATIAQKFTNLDQKLADSEKASESRFVALEKANEARFEALERWQKNVGQICLGALTTVLGGGILWFLTHR